MIIFIDYTSKSSFLVGYYARILFILFIYQIILFKTNVLFIVFICYRLQRSSLVSAVILTIF